MLRDRAAEFGYVQLKVFADSGCLRYQSSQASVCRKVAWVGYLFFENGLLDKHPVAALEDECALYEADCNERLNVYGFGA